MRNREINESNPNELKEISHDSKDFGNTFHGLCLDSKPQTPVIKKYKKLPITKRSMPYKPYMSKLSFFSKPKKSMTPKPSKISRKYNLRLSVGFYSVHSLF